MENSAAAQFPAGSLFFWNTPFCFARHFLQVSEKHICSANSKGRARTWFPGTFRTEWSVLYLPGSFHILIRP